MTGIIITRAEARAQGLKRYFTGLPCIHGHTCERFVGDNSCLECRAIAVAKWRAANPQAWKDSCKASKTRLQAKYTLAQRESYPEKADAFRAACRRYYQKNRAEMIERGKEADRHRRAKLKGAEGSHARPEIKAILEAQRHRCAYCCADLRKSKKHLDHIMPLARGGSNAAANLQWLCAPCNLAKGAKDPTEFAQSRGLLV